MYLIADSGSTKTTWCLSDNGMEIMRISTAGMNPYFQTEEDMKSTVNGSLFPLLKNHNIERIYFYGAGCAFPEKNIIVENALRSFFPTAEISVNSDLLGAALALCGHERGIACILGTGSNSCLFNGESIEEQISPLGFILGDEGSGAVLGKTFIGDCLKKQMPEYLVKAFMEKYNLSPAEIIDRVYRLPFPNRFLASISPFIYEHIDVPAVKNMVYNCFCSFFRRNVMNYTDYDKLKIHFTGSVAYYYKDILTEAANSLGLEVGKIYKEPMDGLVEVIKIEN